MRTFGEAPAASRPSSTRLKTGLAQIHRRPDASFFTKKKLDADTIAELEEALIRADMGAAQATRLAAGAWPRTAMTRKSPAPNCAPSWPREIAAVLTPVAKAAGGRPTAKSPS